MSSQSEKKKPRHPWRAWNPGSLERTYHSGKGPFNKGVTKRNRAQ